MTAIRAARTLVCVLTQVAALSLPRAAGAQAIRTEAPRGANGAERAAGLPYVAVDSAAKQFFEAWGVAWRLSQSSGLPAGYSKSRMAAIRTGTDKRERYFHCHHKKGFGLSEGNKQLADGYAPIRASMSAFSVCPTWPLDDDPTFPDEGDNFDAAIIPRMQETVMTARDKFLAVLGRAVAASPRDSFVVGQFVQFLLDQELADSALAVARACGAKRWWCLSLQGYAEFRLGRATAAESTFHRARALMPQAERCVWDDVVLLSAAELVPFNSQGCAGREDSEERYWWLADPMWSVPGNDRRLVHDVRNMEARLRSAFRYDGRIRWDANNGRDALQRMLLRYGWPSYMWWGGAVGDTSHGNWLQDNGSPGRPPYTTYEYSVGRVHTAIDLNALSSPLTASDSAWQLHRPASLSWRKEWFPEEFMKREIPLAQLPRGQTAMLRRDNDIILALATEIAPRDSVGVRDGSTALLLLSAAPGDARVITTSSLQVSGTTFLRGRIASQPALLALEARDLVARPSTFNTSVLRPRGGVTLADSAVAEARTRFGIAPPPTLGAMQPGEIAVSEPVLLRVAGGVTPSPALADALLEQMLGSVVIDVRATPKVGVYWETYGVNARDSVIIGVSIERHVEVGTLRRLGMALRLRGDPNAGVNITWKEPDIGRVASTLQGRVPIQSRTVVLDVSRLEEGPYDLVMSVAKIGGEAVTNVKRIVIAK